MSLMAGSTIVTRVAWTDANGNPVSVSSPTFRVYDDSYEEVYNTSSVTDEGGGVYSAKWAVPAILSPDSEPIVYILSMSGTVGGDSVISRKRVSALFVGDCR